MEKLKIYAVSTYEKIDGSENYVHFSEISKAMELSEKITYDHCKVYEIEVVGDLLENFLHVLNFGYINKCKYEVIYDRWELSENVEKRQLKKKEQIQKQLETLTKELEKCK